MWRRTGGEPQLNPFVLYVLYYATAGDLPTNASIDKGRPQNVAVHRRAAAVTSKCCIVTYAWNVYRTVLRCTILDYIYALIVLPCSMRCTANREAVRYCLE